MADDDSAKGDAGHPATTADETGAATAIATVSIKLPPFGPRTRRCGPPRWTPTLPPAESHHRKQFDYVIASLAPEVATEVQDLILKPPTANQYDVLKEQLIRRTAASEQRRLQQLLNTEDLGDRKPTQLLRRMKQLLGERVSSTEGMFLRELFLQCLSSNVRMVLASTSPTTTLDELAELADKILEVATPTISATSVSLNQQLLSEVEATPS